MQIFILGKGFVANHLPYPKIEDRVTFSNIGEILDRYSPNILINCIGRTGSPNVDWCESNKEITASTNTALSIILAEECCKRNTHLIQIGSGCIYFGDSPNKISDPNKKSQLIIGGPSMIDAGWKENDFANPKSFYSKTKYASDLILESLPYVTTLRIRMPISDKNHPRNLINKLKNYSQVIDISNSVTFMNDLAKCVDWVIQNKKTGTFHVTNPQPLTAARIMREYQKYVPSHSFEIFDEQGLDAITSAKRSNCILNTDKLSQAGFVMTNSEQALVECMNNYIKNISESYV
jgi:3,5-epimerase/4-reductase